jgi:hypothetical protein
MKLIPPPCMNLERAAEIYVEPFKRIIEYITICNVDGEVCEFGTFNGYTAHLFAQMMRYYGTKKTLHLFDSWEGFPEITGNDLDCKEVKDGLWKRGDCQVYNAREDLELSLNIFHKTITHKGFYTPDMWIPDKIALAHIDCDLYESTIIVLNAIKPHLSEGAVLIFDDFNNNLASNRFGERKALKDSGINVESWFTYGSSCYVFLANV